MYVLSETLKRGHHDFESVRWFAALAVMLGHFYRMQSGGFESMHFFTHLDSFGSLAVDAFFPISGMLVSASYAAHSRVLPFIVARAS